MVRKAKRINYPYRVAIALDRHQEKAIVEYMAKNEGVSRSQAVRHILNAGIEVLALCQKNYLGGKYG